MIKPTLTKIEAAAFKDFIINNASKENRVYAYMQNHQKWFGEFAPLKEMGFDKFVLALYNGYEVEKDLSDDIMFILKDHFSHSTTESIANAWNSIMEAIEQWNKVNSLKDSETNLS